jgi:hypothetical protein
VDSVISTLHKAQLVYQQIEPNSEPLKGSVSMQFDSFIAEMMWQHTEGYLELLDLDRYIDLMKLLEAK